MGNYTIISLDGSWDHKRRGNCCIVVVIDQTRKKIIDFEIIQKSTKSHKTDYSGSSQGMETEAVTRISRRLKDDKRIIGYVHDRDSSVTSFMAKHWNLTEYIDRNHSVKCLATYFKKDIENFFGKQDMLFTHLYNFMNFLISFPCSNQTKVDQWLNAADHYSGNHSKCRKHRPSSYVWELAIYEECYNQLKQFLKDTTFILIQCQLPFSTQLNECYNAMKSHCADKEVAWRKTLFARLCCAILDFNEVPGWRLTLRKQLNLPDLPLDVLVRINQFEKNRQKFLYERRQLKYQQAVRIQRFNERNASKNQDTSGYTGKPKNAY